MAGEEARPTKPTKTETDKKLTAQEILKLRILPMIDRYQQVLTEDVASLDPGYRLEEMSQKDLERHKNDLTILKEMLGEFCAHPDAFMVGSKKTDYQDGDRYTLRLGRKTETGRRLPTDPAKAIRQLNFHLVVKEPEETREELLSGESLKGQSPLNVLLKTEMKISRRISLQISTITLYFDELAYKPKIGFRSGVSISCTEDGIRTQGVIAVGRTDHFTRPLPEKGLTNSECQTLVNYIVTKPA